MSAGRRALSADLGLLAVALIWGVNFSVMKAALEDVHPFAYNAARLALSAAFLALWQRREAPSAATPRGWLGPRVVFLGLLGNVAYQVLFLLGLELSSASSSALLIATSPIFTPILAAGLVRERLPRQAWAGVLVGFAGSALVIAFSERDDSHATSLLGSALTLAAAVCWSLYTVLNQPLLARVPPARLALLVTLVALPVHVALAAPHHGDLTRSLVSPWLAAALLFSGVFSTGVAYVLWNAAIRAVGPSHTAAAGNLVPVIAVLVAWLALGERLAPWQLAGGALVLAGLALVRHARAPV